MRTLGYATSNVAGYLLVDSGACDSIAHPSAFPNTNTTVIDEFRKVNGSCAGEAAQDMGTKWLRTGTLRELVQMTLAHVLYIVCAIDVCTRRRFYEALP